MFKNVGYRPVTLSPLTGRPYTQGVRPNDQYDNIFASGMRGNRDIGDSFESRRPQEADESESVNGSPEADDTPIGQAAENFSEQDKQIVASALQKAGVPESMLQVANEHYAAMKDAAKTSTTNAVGTQDQETINKLAEFLKNYSEQFGDQGEDISKSEYLKNVGEMFKADMEEQGKPYVDPNSGFFDVKKGSNFMSPDDIYNTAKAFQDVNKTGFDPKNASSAIGTTNDSANAYADYYNAHKNDSRYAGMSEFDKKNKIYDAWRIFSNSSNSLTRSLTY